MIRLAFWSLDAASGLSAGAAPVAGSTRSMAPFRSTGSPAGRRTLWLRSAPPSAVGAVSVPPTPAGGSPHGFLGGGEPEPPPDGRALARRRVVRVEEIEVRARREARVEREAEQAAVPVVVDLVPEVGDHGRRRVREAVEDLDEPTLLGDEDSAVGREAHIRGL